MLLPKRDYQFFNVTKQVIAMLEGRRLPLREVIGSNHYKRFFSLISMEAKLIEYLDSVLNVSFVTFF